MLIIEKIHDTQFNLRLPWSTPRRWRSVLERSPCKRKIGCSYPNRDRSKSIKTDSESFTFEHFKSKYECHRYSSMTNINGRPVSQVCHAKEPSLPKGTSTEYRSKCAAFHLQWLRPHIPEWD